MPIYEYKCRTCGEDFEKLITVSKHRRQAGCPACGGIAEQQISIPHAASWSSDWKFPNLAHEGDGNMQFDSKESYEKYLQSEGIVEVGAPKGEGKPSTFSRFVYGPRETRPISGARGTW